MVSKFLLLFSFYFSSHIALAEPLVVSLQPFQSRAQWIWSYSEWDKDEKKFLPPYLYEKYQVVAWQGSKVTIEMSSGTTLDHSSPAHHKFIADVAQCLKKGQSKQTFKSFKIQFYSKSFGNNWTLVSGKHKALAFTEKFNCFSGNEPFQMETVNHHGEELSVIQWTDFITNSWYLNEPIENLQGVMARRLARDILVKLETPLVN